MDRNNVKCSQVIEITLYRQHLVQRGAERVLARGWPSSALRAEGMRLLLTTVVTIIRLMMMMMTRCIKLYLKRSFGRQQALWEPQTENPTKVASRLDLFFHFVL